MLSICVRTIANGVYIGTREHREKVLHEFLYSIYLFLLLAHVSPYVYLTWIATVRNWFEDMSKQHFPQFGEVPSSLAKLRQFHLSEHFANKLFSVSKKDVLQEKAKETGYGCAQFLSTCGSLSLYTFFRQV